MKARKQHFESFQAWLYYKLVLVSLALFGEFRGSPGEHRVSTHSHFQEWAKAGTESKEPKAIFSNSVLLSLLEFFHAQETRQTEFLERVVSGYSRLWYNLLICIFINPQLWHKWKLSPSCCSLSLTSSGPPYFSETYSTTRHRI